MSRLITVEGSLMASVTKRVSQYTQRGLRVFCSECSHCRECDQVISPFDSVCSRCGASSPAAVSAASVALVIGLGMSVLILLAILF
jgi:hypothetical protein